MHPDDCTVPIVGWESKIGWYQDNFTDVVPLDISLESTLFCLFVVITDSSGEGLRCAERGHPGLGRCHAAKIHEPSFRIRPSRNASINTTNTANAFACLDLLHSYIVEGYTDREAHSNFFATTGSCRTSHSTQNPFFKSYFSIRGPVVS